MPINYTSAIDKLLDYVPDLMDKVNCIINRTMNDKQEELKRKYENQKAEETKSNSGNEENTDKEVIENAEELDVKKEIKEEKGKMPKRIKKNYEVEYDETDL